ncbi:MAG: ribonuclease H-like domain-containing protein [Candidatus Sumerlaeaceae bacterium]|jgi:uncharacterized protein YprB with RNaseH-like and TPR domain
MPFDELEDIARAKRERIEELLAKLGGTLRRASELTVQPALSANVPLTELLPDIQPHPSAPEGLLHRVIRIPISDESAHPRGYTFRPLPLWDHHTPEIASETLTILGCDPPSTQDVPLEHIAFLDTETTGLSGATGTYAFLVGIGYFRFDWPIDLPAPSHAEFICEQFFMEDYPHEPVLLAALAERLRQFRLLVTFNGAAYDLPLLQARATLNRTRLPLEGPHVDLLRPARRIWRRRIGSCALASLERHVLGIARTHDVPGALIPSIYFDHLRGLGRERLVPVLDHNVQDIVSLGAILLLLREMAINPAHRNLCHAADTFGLANLLMEAGAEDAAAAYLERAAELGPDPQWARQFVNKAVRMYRRAGRSEEGAKFLEALCRRAGRRHPELFTELAKWYEHQVRAPDRALAAIADAERQAHFLRNLSQLDATQALAWDRTLRDLAARRCRLEKRVSKRPLS